MQAKCLRKVGNFYKFTETAYDQEVENQISRLRHFFFKYKNAKKKYFLSPMNVKE